MTLTEYLQTAVTELRACRCDNERAVLGLIWKCPVHGCDEVAQQRRALADHVEAMMAVYREAERRLDEYAAKGMAASSYDYLWHRLGVFDGIVFPRLASLISTFTGVPIPEGADK